MPKYTSADSVYRELGKSAKTDFRLGSNNKTKTNKMDLREIKTRKANLEDEILVMIKNFMNETGVSVNSIDFNVRISGNDVHKITSSNVKIRVEI